MSRGVLSLHCPAKVIIFSRYIGIGCTSRASYTATSRRTLHCSVSSEFHIQTGHASAGVFSAAGGKSLQHWGASRYSLSLSYLHALRTGGGCGSSSNMLPDLYQACVNVLWLDFNQSCMHKHHMVSNSLQYPLIFRCGKKQPCNMSLCYNMKRIMLFLKNNKIDGKCVMNLIE